jgi:hypothetical protein
MDNISEIETMNTTELKLLKLKIEKRIEKNNVRKAYVISKLLEIADYSLQTEDIKATVNALSSLLKYLDLDIKLGGK